MESQRTCGIGVFVLLAYLGYLGLALIWLLRFCTTTGGFTSLYMQNSSQSLVRNNLPHAYPGFASEARVSMGKYHQTVFIFSLVDGKNEGQLFSVSQASKGD